ncbi:MAG: hypothetical protein NTX75_00895 [Proteobacteria bacterium]|nr:hypothetical protein [Pseudomonadota bacterium]
MTDKFITKGFADYIIESRGYHNTFLEKIDRLIDWQITTAFSSLCLDL